MLNMKFWTFLQVCFLSFYRLFAELVILYNWQIVQLLIQSVGRFFLYNNIEAFIISHFCFLCNVNIFIWTITYYSEHYIDIVMFVQWCYVSIFSLAYSKCIFQNSNRKKTTFEWVQKLKKRFFIKDVSYISTQVTFASIHTLLCMTLQLFFLPTQAHFSFRK